MTKPVRLQLSRKRGFNLQEHSKSVNGLEAVNVARPTKWGNPAKIGEDLSYFLGPQAVRASAAQCVELYRNLMEAEIAVDGDKHIRALRGKNLACWCAPGDPCHADVLLDLANDFKCEAA